MKLDLSKLLPMGSAIVLVWTAGVALGYIDKLGLGPASVALFSIPVIAFLGLLRAGAHMKEAITASFAIGYFSLLAALATSSRTRAQIDTEVGQQLWLNFTYLVGVIVLSYFGSTAVKDLVGASRDSGYREHGPIQPDPEDDIA